MEKINDVKMNKYFVFLEYFLIISVVIILLFIILFINISAINYFRSLKDYIFNEFSKLTDLNIKFRRISPFLIGKVKIFEVILYDNKGLRLELGNVEIYYSIFSLFTNQKNPLSILKRIVFKNLELRIYNNNDYENVRNIINKIKSIKRPNNRQVKIKKLSVEIPKGKISVFNKGQEYILESDNLKIFLSDIITIDSFFNFYINNRDTTLLHSRLNAYGSIKNVDKNYFSKINIDLQNIRFPDKTETKIQKFIIETQGGDFIFRRIEDTLPINFIIKKSKDTISTDIDISNLDVKKLFKSEIKNKFSPNILTLKSNLNINLKSIKEDSGKIILNSFYDKLLFLNKFNVDLDISLKNRNIFFNKFLISNITPQNYIELSGNYPLYDSDYKLVLDIHNFLLPLTKINTKIQISKSKNLTSMTNNNLLINNVNYNDFQLDFYKEYNNIRIKTIKDFNGYSINGYLYKNNKHLSTNLNHSFKNFSIGKIINTYLKDYNKKVVLNGEFTSESNRGNFHIDSSDLIILENNLKSSNINLEYQSNSFYLKYLENNKEFPLNISAYVNFNKKPLSISLNYQKNKTRFDIVSTILDKNIKSVINDNLSIEYAPIDNLLYFNADKFLISNDGLEITSNFIINLSNKTINENKIFINNIKLFKNKTGNLTALMMLRDNKLSVKNIRYKDKINNIEGEIINEFKLIDNNFMIRGNGTLNDDLKGESYNIDYDIENKNVKANLYITHMNINKFVEKNISGYINSRININGDIKNPDINFEFNLSEGKIKKMDLIAYLIMQKKDNNININKAAFQIDQNRIYIKNSSIIARDLNSIRLDINGDILLKGLQKIFKTNFAVSGYADSFLKEDSNLNINILFENLTLGLMKGYNLSEVEKYPNQQFNISKKDNIINVLNEGSDFLTFEKNNNNILIKFFDKENTALDSTIEILKDRNISGKIKFIKFPVNIVQKILIPFVGINGGFLDGDIELKGKLLDPEFYGELNVFYGLVSMDDYLQEPIENITGIIIADKNRLLVKNVNAQVKNGLAHGYGEMLFNGWKLERYEFHINTDLIPALIHKGPIDAKGIGYINDFIIEGRPKNFNFIGYFVIEEADINLESLLGLNKKQKIMTTPVNVYIYFTSGNNVKIFHPLISGTVAPGEKITLKYIGNEAKVYLGGKFKLRKGEVNYLNKRFTIENAEFQFFDDEAKINPKVNLSAYFRTRDYKRDYVKIYLTMNDRLIPFKTNFYATPYKNQEDINAMLGFPVANLQKEENYEDFNNNENRVNIETITNTTDYISNSLILTPFENKIRKTIRLDTFSLETKFLGNIIKSNYESSNNTLDLLDETSVKLGKYLTNQLYFESILSFNKKSYYDELFFLPLNDQNYGLNLKLMLQLELQFFSIGYTFLPKDYYNFYKSGHNISFEAEFKF